MNPVIQLHARARRILRDLAAAGIEYELREGIVYWIGHHESIPDELRIEFDTLHSELEDYLHNNPRHGRLRDAQ